MDGEEHAGGEDIVSVNEEHREMVRDPEQAENDAPPPMNDFGIPQEEQDGDGERVGRETEGSPVRVLESENDNGTTNDISNDDELGKRAEIDKKDLSPGDDNCIDVEKDDAEDINVSVVLDDCDESIEEEEVLPLPDKSNIVRPDGLDRVESNHSLFKLEKFFVEKVPGAIFGLNKHSKKVEEHLSHDCSNGPVLFEEEEHNYSKLKDIWHYTILKMIVPIADEHTIKLFRTRKELRIEQDKIVDNKVYIIHPYSSFRWKWDLLMVLLLMYTLVALPITLAFFQDDLPVGWLVFSVLVDVLFLIDIWINFRTAVMIEEDLIITDSKEISRLYLKGWFTVDVVSSLPMDLVTIMFEGSSTSALKITSALRVLRLAKLLRVLRLSRLFRYISRWQGFYDLTGSVLRISKLVFLMLLFNHWNGCTQFLIAEALNFPKDNWVSLYGIQDASVMEQYIWSLFQALSHMLGIGYGRFPPVTLADCITYIVSMLIGGVLFAVFIGNISMLLLSIDSSGRHYKEKLEEVNEYMNYRRLPKGLRLRVHDYYEHKYQKKKFFDEESILHEMSTVLKGAIGLHNVQDLIHKVPFLRDAGDDFIDAVSPRLVPNFFLPGDYVVKKGQKGVLELLASEDKHIGIITDGDFFGEICLLVGDRTRRSASVRASTYCDLYSLERSDFNEILKDFPEVKNKLRSIAVKRLESLITHSNNGETDLKDTVFGVHHGSFSNLRKQSTIDGGLPLPKCLDESQRMSVDLIDLEEEDIDEEVDRIADDYLEHHLINASFDTHPHQHHEDRSNDQGGRQSSVGSSSKFYHFDVETPWECGKIRVGVKATEKVEVLLAQVQKVSGENTDKCSIRTQFDSLVDKTAIVWNVLDNKEILKVTSL
eukprot:Nk52_evm38s164 gene=Nk52_evmTU38s164